MNISHITHYLERNPPVRYQIEELIDSYEISKVEKAKSITQNDLWFLLNQASLRKCQNVESDSLVNLVIKMVYAIREFSKGATVLTTAFVPKKLYISLVEKLGITENAVCKVQFVNVVPSTYLAEDTVVGVGQSKFPYPSVNTILITGKIKNAS